MPEIGSCSKNVSNSPKVAGSEDEVAISLQPVPLHESSDTKIDLQLCDKLLYEARNWISGLKYHKNEDEGYMPVKRQKHGQRLRYKATKHFISFSLVLQHR